MANIWGSQQWIRLVKELTWGTFNGTASTPAGGAVIVWVDLMEDAYSMLGTPERYQIVTAGGGNMLSKTGSQRTRYRGKLKTPLYNSQAANLVNWFATPTGSGSAKALDSWTIDHWTGFEVIRTLGVRPSKGVLSSTDSEQGVVTMLELDLTGKSQVDDNSITLAEPAVTVFPAERPYTLTDIAGLVSLGGSAITTGIKNLKVTYDNNLHDPFHESATIDRLNYRGRRIMVDFEIGLEASTNRIRYEDVTNAALSVGWAMTGPKSVTFNLQGNCFVTSRGVTRKFNEDEYESLSLVPYRDGTSGLDGAVTIV